MKKDVDKRISFNSLIAIEGMDGSGKTTLAKFISEYLGSDYRYQSLVDKIGKRKYDETRSCFNKPTKESIDFYISSYSMYENGVFDRYVGSLLYWGVNDSTKEYFLQKLTEVRKPDLAFIINTGDKKIGERLSKRDKNDKDLQKIKYSSEMNESLIDFYDKWGVKYIIINNNCDIKSSLEQVKAHLDKYIEAAFADLEFKFHNWASIIGLTNTKYNFYELNNIKIDLNKCICNFGGEKYKAFSREDFYKLILIIFNQYNPNKFINSNFNSKSTSIVIDEGVVIINDDSNVISLDTERQNVIEQKIEQIGDNPFSNINKPTIKSDKFKYINDFLVDTRIMKAISYFGDSNDVCIPDGIEILGKHLFHNKDIKYLDIPPTVRVIFNNIISHSPDVQVNNRSVYFNMYEGGLYNKDFSILISATKNFKSFNMLCKKIGKNAFFGYKTKRTIKLNDELMCIGYNPFANSSIQEIIHNNHFTFKDGALLNNEETFIYCYIGKSSTYTNDSILMIGRNAFYWNESLEEINCLNATEVGRNAFDDERMELNVHKDAIRLS